MIYQDINTELVQAINDSPYSTIDYDYLLAKNPSQIRIEEQKIMDTENPLSISNSLRVENILIPSSELDRHIPIRVYQPKEQSDMPVLLYFHGGAFIYGSPEQYDFIFNELSIKLNVLIVSVDYRLAPEHPFPAALNDGYDTLKWLSNCAVQFGGNNENISIGGSSAGGTIAASLAQIARDKKEVTIKNQYLLYPPTDHRLTSLSMEQLYDAPMQSKKSAQYMWKYYLGQHLMNPPKYAVPVLQENLSGLPPATIIVCEFDPLKDEAKQYAQQLINAEVQVQLIEIKTATHAFDFFPTAMTTQFLQQQTEILKNILTK